MEFDLLDRVFQQVDNLGFNDGETRASIGRQREFRMSKIEQERSGSHFESSVGVPAKLLK